MSSSSTPLTEHFSMATLPHSSVASTVPLKTVPIGPVWCTITLMPLISMAQIGSRHPRVSPSARRASTFHSYTRIVHGVHGNQYYYSMRLTYWRQGNHEDEVRIAAQKQRR
jgi:hypothetical protein